MIVFIGLSFVYLIIAASFRIAMWGDIQNRWLLLSMSLLWPVTFSVGIMVFLLGLILFCLGTISCLFVDFYPIKWQKPLRNLMRLL
jgi:hypothetical protein